MTEEQGLTEEAVADAIDELADRVDAALVEIETATAKVRAILAEEPARELAEELKTALEETAVLVDELVEKARTALEDAGLLGAEEEEAEPPA